MSLNKILVLIIFSFSISIFAQEQKNIVEDNDVVIVEFQKYKVAKTDLLNSLNKSIGYDWSDAKSECTEYTQKDIQCTWELPSVMVLIEIYNNREKLDVAKLKQTFYWSISTEPKELQVAYDVDFVNGETSLYAKREGRYVRCVCKIETKVQ